MKIKAGDWVLCNNTKEVMRVVDTMVDTRGLWIRTYPIFLDNGRALADYFTKLPIKFKEFEINANVCELRRIKGNEHNVLFIAYETDDKVCASYQEYVDDSKVYSSCFPTFAQAKDWLESQYATMIAKARGLVC